ncbi:collagen alpha-1(III) chain-like [Orycteropus afer afer]|uniref:Collagen alpha-1(III) chain-like n=1 Tax=Orycteropus afer afer TaxID=1230840 RepID=A0AC54ZF15_ORYAF|nr:collagen alpha-1(III) chain-like [Orycteropus afer afer]
MAKVVRRWAENEAWDLEPKEVGLEMNQDDGGEGDGEDEGDDEDEDDSEDDDGEGEDDDGEDEGDDEGEDDEDGEDEDDGEVMRMDDDGEDEDDGEEEDGEDEDGEDEDDGGAGAAQARGPRGGEPRVCPPALRLRSALFRAPASGCVWRPQDWPGCPLKPLGAREEAETVRMESPTPTPGNTAENRNSDPQHGDPRVDCSRLHERQLGALTLTPPPGSATRGVPAGGFLATRSRGLPSRHWHRVASTGPKGPRPPAPIQAGARRVLTRRKGNEAKARPRPGVQTEHGRRGGPSAEAQPAPPPGPASTYTTPATASPGPSRGPHIPTIQEPIVARLGVHGQRPVPPPAPSHVSPSRICPGGSLRPDLEPPTLWPPSRAPRTQEWESVKEALGNEKDEAAARPKLPDRRDPARERSSRLGPTLGTRKRRAGIGPGVPEARGATMLRPAVHPHPPTAYLRDPLREGDAGAADPGDRTGSHRGQGLGQAAREALGRGGRGTPDPQASVSCSQRRVVWDGRPGVRSLLMQLHVKPRCKSGALGSAWRLALGFASGEGGGGRAGERGAQWTQIEAIHLCQRRSLSAPGLPAIHGAGGGAHRGGRVPGRDARLRGFVGCAFRTLLAGLRCPRSDLRGGAGNTQVFRGKGPALPAPTQFPAFYPASASPRSPGRLKRLSRAMFFQLHGKDSAHLSESTPHCTRQDPAALLMLTSQARPGNRGAGNPCERLGQARCRGRQMDVCCLRGDHPGAFWAVWRRGGVHPEERTRLERGRSPQAKRAREPGSRIPPPRTARDCDTPTVRPGRGQGSAPEAPVQCSPPYLWASPLHSGRARAGLGRFADGASAEIRARGDPRGAHTRPGICARRKGTEAAAGKAASGAVPRLSILLPRDAPAPRPQEPAAARSAPHSQTPVAGPAGLGAPLRRLSASLWPDKPHLRKLLPVVGLSRRAGGRTGPARGSAGPHTTQNPLRTRGRRASAQAVAWAQVPSFLRPLVPAGESLLLSEARGAVTDAPPLPFPRPRSCGHSGIAF